MKYLTLRDIEAYRESFTLSNYVWNIITTWDFLPKSTIGQQFARAVDSISANIAEGFGRFHKKDKIKFYYSSRGSVYESLDWLQKSKIRHLISDNEYKKALGVLTALPKAINSLIKYTEEKLEI